MSALQHLSPDVLEVVRDVARQEDSFLLRVQGVPLRAFVGDGAPRVGPRAPFLSAAERHLLELFNDEFATALEVSLYRAVSKAPSLSETIVPGTLVDESTLQSAVGDLQVDHRSAEWVHYSEGLWLSDLLDREPAWGEWRSFAKAALLIRRRQTTIANVAFGYLGSNDIQSAARSQRQVLAFGEGDSEFRATRGLVAAANGQFEVAARRYHQAWALSGQCRHLAAALVNVWLAERPVPAELRKEADSREEGLMLVAPHFASALRAPINQTICDAIRRRRVSARGPSPYGVMGNFLEKLQ